MISAAPDRLGDIPTWIAGIGTVAAVVLALGLAIRDGRQRDAERKRAQAEKVQAWFQYFDPSHFEQTFRLGNASEQSAFRVIVSVEPHGKPVMKVARKADAKAFRAFIGVLPPTGVSGRIHLPEVGGLDFIWGLELAFTDAAGRNWVRSANGDLGEIKADAAAHYGLEEVGWS